MTMTPPAIHKRPPPPPQRLPISAPRDHEPRTAAPGWCDARAGGAGGRGFTSNAARWVDFVRPHGFLTESAERRLRPLLSLVNCPVQGEPRPQVVGRVPRPPELIGPGPAPCIDAALQDESSGVGAFRDFRRPGLDAVGTCCVKPWVLPRLRQMPRAFALLPWLWGTGEGGFHAGGVTSDLVVVVRGILLCPLPVIIADKLFPVYFCVGSVETGLPSGIDCCQLCLTPRLVFSSVS